MKGSHHVLLETKKVRYEFDIKRNITIIQGDSATGKTTLTNLVSDNARYGEAAGIRLESDVPCVVVDGDSLWDVKIKSLENTIIIIDEGNSFIFTEQFAKVIQETSNYYVLITRKPLKNLPYSINEIYGIRTSGKYHYPEKIYHELYPLYKDEESGAISQEERVLILEDSKAGYQFYQKSISGVKCISADGNSNVYKILQSNLKGKSVTVIADGAAFGAYIAEILRLLQYSDAAAYFPESFEWMILKSGVVKLDQIEDILEHPEEYIDSREYFSWERFFTEVLRNGTSGDSVRAYNKDYLSAFYSEGKNREMILNVLPREIRDRVL